MVKTYSDTNVLNLIDKYTVEGGLLTVLTEGTLLDYGLAVLELDGYKTAIIKEVYLNCWSSGYSVKFYNKIPKKYEVMVDNA